MKTVGNVEEIKRISRNVNLLENEEFRQLILEDLILKQDSITKSNMNNSHKYTLDLLHNLIKSLKTKNYTEDDILKMMQHDFVNKDIK